MKSFVFVLIVSVISVSAQTIDECFRQDSISCVQKSLFRKAKEMFEIDTFDLVTGISLVKTTSTDRRLRSGKDLLYEQEINKATGVVERQSVLENFVGEEVSDFLSGRSLRINFTPAFEKIGESARAISESIPTEVKQAANEIVEGRGKKKMLKKILPLLLLAKVKLGALATLAYFALALIAKKAILASLISIAISAFVGLRGLWTSKSGAHDTTGYNNNWGVASSVSNGWGTPSISGGWSSSGVSGWDDSHSAHAAQNQAFSGYHR